MKMPPYLLKLRIMKQEKGFDIWLPLFIIGPIVLIIALAIFLVALPFILLSVVLTWQWNWLRTMFLGIAAWFRIVWSLPGLKVDVENQEHNIEVVFY